MNEGRTPQPEPALYSTFVQAFFLTGLTGRVTPALKESLFQVGLDLDHLESRYPANHLPLWLERTARVLYPDLPLLDAHEALGGAWVLGWKQTLLGRAVCALTPFLAPHLALGRLERNFRPLDNFTRITMTILGPRAIQMDYAQVLGVPRFYLGLKREGALISRVRAPKVELVAHTPPGASYLCTWDPDR